MVTEVVRLDRFYEDVVVDTIAAMKPRRYYLRGDHVLVIRKAVVQDAHSL